MRRLRCRVVLVGRAAAAIAGGVGVVAKRDVAAARAVVKRRRGVQAARAESAGRGIGLEQSAARQLAGSGGAAR